MASDAAASPPHAVAAIVHPTPPIRRSRSAAATTTFAAAAQTPIRRAAATDPSICKLSIQMGEKGRKMCFACSNGRWLYYIYVRIHKHAVRYVAVACGVLSRRLIHYLPDGTTFLIDSSSFDNFFFARKVRVEFVVLFFLKHTYRCSAFSKFFVINSWLPLVVSLSATLFYYTRTSMTRLLEHRNAQPTEYRFFTKKFDVVK